MAKSRKTSIKNPLLFIDTNIFLDFYRARGRDGKLSILDLIDANCERIITGEQVEMEYKKHRQECINRAIESLRMPNYSVLDVPAFLQEAQPVKMIKKNKKALETQVNRVRKRLQRALLQPASQDPVYQCLQRLFQADGCYHLTRAKKIRNKIRASARKRYLLGYPPRKRGDTSCGDAVNWEWLVHCAAGEMTGERRNVIIVSRDADYGECLNGKSVLNDWLAHEFKDRVSRSRKAILTGRLTEGFKVAGIAVTREQIQEEDSMIAEREPVDGIREDTSGPRHLEPIDPKTIARIRELLERGRRQSSEESHGGTSEMPVSS